MCVGSPAGTAKVPPTPAPTKARPSSTSRSRQPRKGRMTSGEPSHRAGARSPAEGREGPLGGSPPRRVYGEVRKAEDAAVVGDVVIHEHGLAGRPGMVRSRHRGDRGSCGRRRRECRGWHGNSCGTPFHVGSWLGGEVGSWPCRWELREAIVCTSRCGWRRGRSHALGLDLGWRWSPTLLVIGHSWVEEAEVGRFSQAATTALASHAPGPPFPPTPWLS